MAEHDLQSIAFPTLDEAQIARLSGCTAAVPKSFQDGQTLFAVGDRDLKFFVVKSGEVEIVDYSGDEPKTAHRPSQGPVHRRHLPPDRQPGGGQRRRPGPLRGVSRSRATRCGAS